jgi:serine protease Do
VQPTPPAPTETEQTPKTAPTTGAAAGAARITASVGITVIPSRIGVRKSAVAVSEVIPSRGGAEAGLEVGDVILAVNDKQVGSVEELAAALPAAGGTATFLVRDSRTGEDVAVEVVCQKSAAALPPTQQPPPVAKTIPAGPRDELGLATKLTFYQAEAAVQVTDVQPGSVASRAGIRPGWLILAVNDKPVLHPDELKRALASASGRVRLTVADPESKREMNLEIQR